VLAKDYAAAPAGIWPSTLLISSSGGSRSAGWMGSSGDQIGRCYFLPEMLSSLFLMKRVFPAPASEVAAVPQLGSYPVFPYAGLPSTPAVAGSRRSSPPILPLLTFALGARP
jgi:hypothetical protein